MSKKVVIIGAGISGMTAGIYALQQGFQAEIYEKNVVPGGECTGWDRNGYHIDNCMHWLMGTTPGEDLNSIWKTNGALSDDTEYVELDKMYSSELKGERITLWKDIEKTRREMMELSPEDKEEINSLIDDCKAIKGCGIPAGMPSELMGPLDGVKLLKSTGGMLKVMKKYSGMDISDLKKKFKHPLIQNVFSDFNTNEMPAYGFIISYGNFVCGDGGLPKGGSRAFAFRIRDTFLARGGKLFLGKSAKSFNIENGHVNSLVLDDDSQVEGDYFIPSCDPDFVFHKMLDESYMDKVFTDVYHNREAYPIYSMFQAAFAVDSPEDYIHGDVTLDIPEIVENKYMNERMTIKIYPYEPQFAPEGKQVMTVLYGGAEGWYDYWEEIYKDKQAYNESKHHYAEIFQKHIEQRYPEYAGKLTLLDSWSPMTYKRYCNAFKGYNQAYAITKNSMKNPYPSPYLNGLDNVVLSGQWLSAPGGLPGAAITGKYAVQRICKKEKMNYRF